MSLVKASAAALLGATMALSFVACGGPARPANEPCTYATFDGMCQLVAVEDPGSAQVPGQIRARYATRGATAMGKPDVLELTYTVEPRHTRMAIQHLTDNPLLRCQVAYLRTGSCPAVVTRLKVPDMPGRLASGAVQLAPP